MFRWHVVVGEVSVAKCVSADFAHALVSFLWERDGVVAEVRYREGVAFR